MLRAAVQAAAGAELLLKRRRAGSAADAIQQYLVRGKRTGDRVRLFTRDPPIPSQWFAVVAVRLDTGWRLDYVDGRASETCLDNDDGERLDQNYGIYSKLRI